MCKWLMSRDGERLRLCGKPLTSNKVVFKLLCNNHARLAKMLRRKFKRGIR